jgi:FkbM family methyltransferase
MPRNVLAQLRSVAERPLYALPWLHSALLLRRPVPDLNKLTWVRFVRRGHVVLDVGANRGHYAMFFSRKVGRAGRVYAFEPVPASAGALRAHCAGRGNVEVIQCALSDESGRTCIYVPGDDLQQASLTHQAEGSWKRCNRVDRHEIDALTLDAWADRCAPARVDFIKLDVEGAEYKVLRGGRETIRRHRPLLYLEVFRDWMRAFGNDLHDLARVLDALGYGFVYQPTIEQGRFHLLPVDLVNAQDGDVLASWRAL